MLHAVLDGHLTKLERVALAAKRSARLDLEQAGADDKKAYSAYELLDARCVTALVRSEDRKRWPRTGFPNSISRRSRTVSRRSVSTS
jgi:hypothetical protein